MLMIGMQLTGARHPRMDASALRIYKIPQMPHRFLQSLVIDF